MESHVAEIQKAFKRDESVGVARTEFIAEFGESDMK